MRECDLAIVASPTYKGSYTGLLKLFLDRIGAGGMGEVYRARDTRLGRTVAIKVLAASVADDQERRDRFLLEARATAALSHPNISALYEIGEDQGQLFLVFEFVPGETLKTAIAGRPGGKLHTARSRNDQVVTDVTMFTREAARSAQAQLTTYMEVLVATAERHLDCPMPGYTHLQRAQPVYLSHHLLAYVWMLVRDRERFGGCHRHQEYAGRVGDQGE